MAEMDDSGKSTGDESADLTGADNFWLRAGTPENLMQINAVLAFDGRLDKGKVRGAKLP